MNATASLMEQACVISGERRRGKAEIAERAARAAAGLHRAGVGQGDTVALLLRNDIAIFEVSTATTALGAYPVPINWHFKPDEIGYILSDCKAKALVAHRDLLRNLPAQLPPGLLLLVVDTPPEIAAAYGLPAGPPEAQQGTAAQAWDEWLAAHEPWNGQPQLTSSVIYTSGTTGKPKGVMRPPMTEAQAQRAFAMVMGMYGFRMGEPIRTVITGPMYHTAPNGYGLTVFRFGGSVVLQPRFDPLGLLELIEKYRITHLHLVPTMFVRLLKLTADERQSRDLSSLQFVSHGAAPCSPRVKQAMIDWWGPVINEYYGSTETGGITVQSSQDALRKPGSVGRPLPGVKLRIDDDAGKPLATGEAGNIHINTQAMPAFAYLGKSGAQPETDEETYVWVGDIGYLDDDGYLFLCDRRTDIINSGGVNVYTAEIEAALLEIEGIEDCAVFGIPDEEYGESICAHLVVHPAASLTEEGIKSFLSERLSGYKLPRRIVFADALPREESGKVFKRKIREPYWTKADRAI
ncbi:MAG: AMP-binding protein [Proteobacteria bacterium]|nr:AMP-binding protein [Pseudomonadota bacterium]